MTDEANINVDITHQVGIITLNRPHVHNALDRDTVRAVARQMESFDEDAGVRVIVINGSGPAFAAGADIQELEAASATSLELDDPFADWDRLRRIHKPVIASVHGVALGGGFELALHCDIVLAAEDAVFGFPEVSLGVMPGAGGTQLLTKVVGRRRAVEMIWLGSRLSAWEAKTAGIVNHVFHEAVLAEETLRLAGEIAGQAPVSVRLIKEAVHAAEDVSLMEGMKLERKNFYLTFATDDQSEGMQAFMEKRAPRFKGE